MSFAEIPTELEQYEFSLPHVLCLVGEQQYLLSAGAIFMAIDRRLSVGVHRRGGAFRVGFGGGGADAEFAGPEVEALRDRWQAALTEEAVADPASLDGLHVHLHFDHSFDACPLATLATCPATAAALTAAALAAEFTLESTTEVELAERACRVLRRVRGVSESPDRFYGRILTVLNGGALHVEPGRNGLNVQQLLPPESMLLALRQGLGEAAGAIEQDAEVGSALRAAIERNEDVVQRGDAGFSALFEMDEGVLDEREITMVYGLLRVRQMTEAFLEHLGEPYVDNDRLAEICDEESAILRDYFGFPAEPFAAMRSRAGEAGALGSKMTWVLGGYPAAIILAPGRREEVRQTLQEGDEPARFLPVDMEPTGLRWGPVDLETEEP
ncbi:MAG: hypothetical protein R6X33_09140 [Candidatus Brocadiia bacterium]